MKKLFVIFVLSFVLTNSILAQTENKKVLDLSEQIVKLLKIRDLTQLSAFVNPAKGLYFAPFALDMSLKKNVSKSKLPKLFADKREYYWAKPITNEDEYTVKMSFAKYYERFLNQVDFEKPKSINFNKSHIFLNTQIQPESEFKKAFPKSVMVEYIYDGMDSNATSLFLIFQKIAGRWYLICLTQIDQNTAHYIF